MLRYGPLGRNEPPDKRHIEKYPLAGLAVELQPVNSPVVIGVPWYTDFDNPIQGSDGVYRLTENITGTVRGGHCVCLRPPTVPDSVHNWAYYDQGEEGACEGFGHSRGFSLHYGVTFNGFWVYDDARRYENNFPNGEGSTNRSACAALVEWGAHFETGQACQRTPWALNVPGREIASYHWATTADEVCKTLGVTDEQIPLLNSWGTNYPHEVMLPAKTLDRLLHEEGEADVMIFRS